MKKRKIHHKNDEEEEDDKPTQFKLFLVDFLTDSTTHGLSHMFRTEHSIIKLMWFLLFVASIVVTSYLVCDNVLDFLSYDVVTQISIIYESPTLFPTITLYNLNRPSSLSLRDILIRCSFNGAVCDDTYFETRYDLAYTYFQFNNGRNYTSQRNATLLNSMH